MLVKGDTGKLQCIRLSLVLVLCRQTLRVITLFKLPLDWYYLENFQIHFLELDVDFHLHFEFIDGRVPDNSKLYYMFIQTHFMYNSSLHIKHSWLWGLPVKSNATLCLSRISPSFSIFKPRSVLLIRTKLASCICYINISPYWLQPHSRLKWIYWSPLLYKEGHITFQKWSMYIKCKYMLSILLYFRVYSNARKQFCKSEHITAVEKTSNTYTNSWLRNQIFYMYI